MFFNTVKQRWRSGKGEELRFWREVLGRIGENGKHYGEMLARADPGRPFEPWLLPYVRTVPPADARILDVASGPISCLGWVHEGRPMDIVAVDALADDYNRMLAQAGIAPPVSTMACEAEAIGGRFPRGSFDLVHIRNALDHCFDPFAVLGQGLDLLKPGAALVVQGYVDEAARENYQGFHQWNVARNDGQVRLWRPGREILLPQALGRATSLEIIRHAPESRWLAFALARPG